MTAPVQDIPEAALGISSRRISASAGMAPVPAASPSGGGRGADRCVGSRARQDGEDAMRNDQDRWIWRRSSAPLTAVAWKGLGELHPANRLVVEGGFPLGGQYATPPSCA